MKEEYKLVSVPDYEFTNIKNKKSISFNKLHQAEVENYVDMVAGCFMVKLTFTTFEESFENILDIFAPNDDVKVHYDTTIFNGKNKIGSSSWDEIIKITKFEICFKCDEDAKIEIEGKVIQKNKENKE